MNNQNFLKRKKTRYWVIGLVVALIAAFVFFRVTSARANNTSTEPTGSVTTVKVAQTVEASGPLAA